MLYILQLRIHKFLLNVWDTEELMNLWTVLFGKSVYIII